MPARLPHASSKWQYCVFESGARSQDSTRPGSFYIAGDPALAHLPRTRNPRACRTGNGAPLRVLACCGRALLGHCTNTLVPEAARSTGDGPSAAAAPHRAPEIKRWCLETHFGCRYQRTR